MASPAEIRNILKSVTDEAQFAAIAGMATSAVVEADPLAEVRSKTLEAQLESLSGVFGEIVTELPGNIITNDRGLHKILPELKERANHSDKDGIGFFVGAGGSTSLLPELEIGTPVVVDRNTSVLQFSEALGEVIATKAKDFSQLPDQESVCRQAVAELRERKGVEVINHILAKYGNLDWVSDRLIAEAQRYGETHWSNPQHVMAVAEATQKHPPTYIATDLQSADFARAFSAISSNHSKQITFANLTNLHEWIPHSKMDFMRALPFAPNATILFSSAGRSPLEMEVAGSLDEYIEKTAASWARVNEAPDATAPVS